MFWGDVFCSFQTRSATVEKQCQDDQKCARNAFIMGERYFSLYFQPDSAGMKREYESHLVIKYDWPDIFEQRTTAHMNCFQATAK